MKFFVLLFVLLSICYGLNARCISDDCPRRVFEEPKPREIHYIYHGESCDCPKYHDVIVQKLQPTEISQDIPSNIEYNIDTPKVKTEDEKVTRYLFDVRVEKPVTPSPKTDSASYDLQFQEAPQVPDEKKNSIRYIFDTRVEQPCKDKPWEGLVTQIDAVLVPKQPGSCSNPDHTPGTCNCGCQNPTHTPATCDCIKDLFNIPIMYSSVESKNHRRTKRNTKNKNKQILLPPLKESNIKFPKIKPLKKVDTKSLKKIEPKELSDAFKIDLRRKRITTTTPKPPRSLQTKQTIRLKRKEKSPCGYEFESCDLKRKSPAGCPLCYKCTCEPAGDSENQKFSPRNIKIPYRIVTHDQEFSPATQQEFDHEPPAYTGLQKPDMYKQYIDQIISKYPEHMSRKMPNLMDQQHDLMDFIDDLAKHDRSPPDSVAKNEDTRYQILDDALDLYKLYENAIGRKPAAIGNRKLFNKRGTVLEVIEVDPDDLKSGNFKLPDFNDSSSDNSSN